MQWKKTGWSKIEISEKEFSLKLERNVGGVVAEGVPMQPVVLPASTEQPQIEEVAGVPDGKAIKSPLVGIFHPLAGDKAVKIGDKLKKGDVICMVEAMKLMNEILMPEDGEIVWIAAEDGDMVEYDQLLFNYV